MQIFVYIFDASTGTPTSLTVDVQYSMAETLRRAVMNTIMGIAIVFIVLIFLSFLIYLFRFIPNPEAKKKAQAAAAPAPATTGGSTSGSSRSRRYRTDRGYRSSNCSS